MAIDTTYTEFLLEQIIQEILLDGENPSASEITERYNTFIEDNDITKPLFSANNYSVEYGEASSASKFNNTNQAILRDLKVLYKHLLKISDQAIVQFNRWRTEAQLLEGRLNTLEDRISSLLLISSDTAGFFNFVQDNFTDNSLVDLPNTTAYVNVDKGVVSLGTSSAGATRIDLTDLQDKNIEFTVLSRNNLVSTVSTQGSRTKYVVSDVSNFFQERVYTNKPTPVSVEVKVDMLTSQSISRIDIDLHMANQNSTVQLTPMYSTDNYTWKQLPVSNYTRSVVDKTIFQFSPVAARYVKFIMTKQGFDQVHNELYAYEFGVDEIAFFNEGFSSTTTGVLVSKPLYVNDTDGNPEEFSKIVLEVCEDVPDDTGITYYVSASNDATAPLTGFTAIDPLGRASSVNPTIIDFGELDIVVVSGIKVSYEAGASIDSDINPARDFTFIHSTSGTTANTYDATASGVRYAFYNQEDRILDHQVASGIRIATGTLELWRNVNQKNNDTKVRGYANGWGFEEPYYKTTVDVENTSSYSVDFGGENVVVDGEIKSGKIVFSKGKHSIWVHKNNWKAITYSSVSDLTTLKAADSLYPYNHRYLVEGFNYPSGWSDNEEKVYRGFDTVAQYFMKEVSVFDLVNNIQKDDYSRFARDFDVEDTDRLFDGSAASYTGSSTTFLLKVDATNPDFVNEDFMLRFKSASSLFKYLRFKAVLSTSDTSITPFLDSYRIKLSS